METLRTALRRFLVTRQDKRMTEAELADLGLSRADVTRLVTGVSGTRVRMEKMAAQFELSRAAIDQDRGTAMDLAMTCAHCGEAHRCMKAIAAGTRLNEGRCPNAVLYKLLASASASDRAAGPVPVA